MSKKVVDSLKFGDYVLKPLDVVCVFDPQKDIQAVEQFGAIDLQKANATSSIPVVDGLQEEKYNGIEDPRSIGARPADDFEAMQANKAIVGYKAPQNNEE